MRRRLSCAMCARAACTISMKMRPCQRPSGRPTEWPRPLPVPHSRKARRNETRGMNLLEAFERPDPPAQQVETGFFTDTTLCIGCKACEVACKQWNQLPGDGFNWTANSYDNTVALSATTWRHVAFIEQM